MGDRERNQKSDPKEDLERYIEEEKRRKGSTLKDENLKRLIFCAGGPSVVDEQRNEGNSSGQQNDSHVWEDLELSLELAHEDYQRTYGTNLRRESEDEEVYEDARSYFDPSSTASPSAHSPSFKGSIDPLSPNTSQAVDRMSRVSISSPAGAAPPPGYYPPNGQGVAAYPGAVPGVSYPAVPPQNPPLPTQVNHQSAPIPINHLPPNASYQTNGVRVPYPPPMAPPSYIPQSMPLPPTVPNGAGPSRNEPGIPSSSSAANPLFSAYVPPSTHQYSIHSHASPYLPMHYPPAVSRGQRTNDTQPEAMSRFLAQQQQMTSRMMAQCSNQMQQMQPMRPPLQHLQQPSQQRQQQQQQPLPPCAPSTSAIPPSSDIVCDKNLYSDPFESAQDRVERQRKRREEIMKKPVSQMTNEELVEASIEAKNRELKLRLKKHFGSYREDEDGDVFPPEKKGGGLYILKGDKRFPLPPGKDMSFYITPKPEYIPPTTISPSPIHNALEYVDEVPTCAVGKDTPLLCRGHANTKERLKHPDVFGGNYMKLIQHVFHSVNGDPSRVPNASTTGETWEYPFKEGEEPMGMEVYRNVRGRMWNSDYDYSPVFNQLRDKERLWGYSTVSLPVPSTNRTASEERRVKGETLSKISEVPLAGNVFEVYPCRDYDDSDFSDCDDGRIAVGREELEKVQAQKEIEKEKIEEKKNKEKAEKKRKSLVRDSSRKIHDGYYPTLLGNKHWGRISYYEKAFHAGEPYMCKFIYPKVYVDPHGEKNQYPDRYALASIHRLDRDEKTQKVLMQPNMTFYFKCEPGGYLVLCSDSDPPLFVQSPLYNAMMGEELDTIVRITKGHELIIFDENFFNLLLHQAYQYGDSMVYEMEQLVHTRVSCTKGWGEAYQKSTILDALVWIEFTLLNAMRKIDTLFRGDTTLPKTISIKEE